MNQVASDDRPQVKPQPAPHNAEVYAWDQYPTMDALEAIAADHATATCHHTYNVGDTYTEFQFCGAPATCVQVYEDLWDTPSGVLMGRDVRIPLCPFHGGVAEAHDDTVWAWTRVEPKPYNWDAPEPPF